MSWFHRQQQPPPSQPDPPDRFDEDDEESGMPRGIECTCEEAARLISGGDVVLLDVREPWEWSQARLKGAVHVPLRQVPSRVADLKDRAAALAPTAPVLVYCAHGMRSLDAALFLRSQGIEGARSIAGGLAQWMEQGIAGVLLGNETDSPA
jgi:rhodanese-related sulfurtransferase